VCNETLPTPSRLAGATPLTASSRRQSDLLICTPAQTPATPLVVSGCSVCVTVQVSTRIEEIFQKESDPFTTNEGMLDVINTIRFRLFDAALEEALGAAGDKVGSHAGNFNCNFNYIYSSFAA
jgi:hypothetical protein